MVGTTHHQYSRVQGFTPGSVESIKALQMEHRYELQSARTQQPACVISAGVGKRALAHSWQAQMDQRNADTTQRELAGRKSAAALEWLLKRQAERTRMDEEMHKPRKPAGSLSQIRASPNNPLASSYEQQPAAALPSPAEMAAALAALDLAAASAAAKTPAAAAAPAPQQEQQQQQPAEGTANANSCSCSQEGCGCACACASADGAIQAAATATATAAGEQLEEGSDAVAVIADAPEAVLPHMVSHLCVGSLSPEPEEEAGQRPLTPRETAQQVRMARARAAYFKQQEVEELMTALLQEYPHGIPRKMMMDLRQLGVADAPALGHGCTSSSLVHDTLLLSKRI